MTDTSDEITERPQSHYDRAVALAEKAVHARTVLLNAEAHHELIEEARLALALHDARQHALEQVEETSEETVAMLDLNHDLKAELADLRLQVRTFTERALEQAGTAGYLRVEPGQVQALHLAAGPRGGRDVAGERRAGERLAELTAAVEEILTASDALTNGVHILPTGVARLIDLVSKR